MIESYYLNSYKRSYCRKKTERGEVSYFTSYRFYEMFQWNFIFL